MTTSRSQLSCCIYPAPHGLIAQHDLNRAPVEEVHLVSLLTSMNFTQGVRDMFTEAQVLKVNHARRITNAKERPYQIRYHIYSLESSEIQTGNKLRSLRHHHIAISTAFVSTTSWFNHQHKRQRGTTIYMT